MSDMVNIPFELLLQTIQLLGRIDTSDYSEADQRDFDSCAYALDMTKISHVLRDVYDVIIYPKIDETCHLTDNQQHGRLVWEEL